MMVHKLNEAAGIVQGIYRRRKATDAVRTLIRMSRQLRLFCDGSSNGVIVGGGVRHLPSNPRQGIYLRTFRICSYHVVCIILRPQRICTRDQ